MEWRCEWCGKPHASDDPPCDNCGHGSFERAVVQGAPAGEGNAETTLWVCTECGREHPRHSPPCSRCGNATLERQARSVDDDELTAPSYLDLLTPRYAVALVVVLGLAAVFLLGLAGVVDLPGMNQGVPDVADVPGDPDSIDGLSLATVEDRTVEAVSDRVSAAGGPTLARTDRLDEVATYVNQRRVKTAYADGTLPSQDQLEELLSGPCSGGARFLLAGPIEPSETTAAELAETLSAELLRDTEPLPQEFGRTGIDVHAGPDGQLYALQIAC